MASYKAFVCANIEGVSREGMVIAAQGWTGRGGGGGGMRISTPAHHMTK